MVNKTFHHTPHWATRFLCLVMASLTACTTTRSQYVWHDVGTQQAPGMPKASQIVESWGAKPQGATVADPDIAPGFLITMHCLADNKLNGDYRVDTEGNLQLPYDMTVNTTGVSMSELHKKLAEVYRPYFKTPSNIEVRLKERVFWVDVRGLVEKPGRYLVEPEASLDQVIGLAGGTNRMEPPLYVRIQKGPKVFIFDLNQYYSRGEDHPQILGWLGGEVLFFQRESVGGEKSLTSAYRMPVYMLGEVRKPGQVTLDPGADFIDSLVQAGGFTERADLDNIEIIRRTGGRKRVYDFSWNEFQHAPAPQVGDVVLVHADNVTKGERKVTLIATVIAALASIATAAILILAYDRGGFGTTR